jgi:hypothetical protein
MNDGKYKKLRSYLTNFNTFTKALAAAAMVMALGCTEEPVEGPADLGEKANPEDIELALGKATDGTTVHTAKVDQYVHYEENYRVDINPVIKISDLMRKLIQIKDSTTSRTYVLKEDYFEYSTGGKITDEKHSEAVLEYQKTAPPTATEIQAMTMADSDCGKERKDSDGVTYDCLEFYNFETYVADETVPERVAQRPNCGNVPNCKLPARVIKFSRVKFLKGKMVGRQNLRFSISKAIPVLFPDMDILPFNYFCSAQLYMLTSTSYYVNRCTVLRDLSL